jgi:hypothetical protein
MGGTSKKEGLELNRGILLRVEGSEHRIAYRGSTDCHSVPFHQNDLCNSSRSHLPRQVYDVPDCHC